MAEYELATYELTTIGPDSLDDFLSLNMTPPIREALEHDLRSGALTYDKLYLFRHGGKPEAAFTVTASPIVVPRIDFEISEGSTRRFAALLRELLGGRDKIVIIDSVLAPADASAFTDAGWTVTSHDKLYRTDLTSGQWVFAADAEELSARELLSPALRDFYDDILKMDTHIGDTGTDDPEAAFGEAVLDDDLRLFVVRSEGRIVAAATLFPIAPEEVGVHLLGVVPAQRNKGLGRRLHAHVLAVASSHARFHVGGTRADNLAMHAIYLKNGSTLLSEQTQLTL